MHASVDSGQLSIEDDLLYRCRGCVSVFVCWKLPVYEKSTYLVVTSSQMESEFLFSPQAQQFGFWVQLASTCEVGVYVYTEQVLCGLGGREEQKF